MEVIEKETVKEVPVDCNGNRICGGWGYGYGPYGNGNVIGRYDKIHMYTVNRPDFKLDESFDDYILRIDSIKKLKAEIEKLTKTMNSEKQPNLRMALNDKIKLMKKELQKMVEL